MENLINALEIFTDCINITGRRGYYMGYKVYEVWSDGLRDDKWYDDADDEQLARRLDVNCFCFLSRCDARKAAYVYLDGCKRLGNDNQNAAIAHISDLRKYQKQQKRGLRSLIIRGTPMAKRPRNFGRQHCAMNRLILLTSLQSLDR